MIEKPSKVLRVHIHGDAYNLVQKRFVTIPRDEISLLPRKCAIEIFSYLDLIDLGRCAQVCRAWKVISGAPSLWSHVNFGGIKHR